MFKPTLPAVGNLRLTGRLLTDRQGAGRLPGQVCRAAPSRLPVPLPGSQQDKQPQACTQETVTIASPAAGTVFAHLWARAEGGGTVPGA